MSLGNLPPQPGLISFSNRGSNLFLRLENALNRNFLPGLSMEHKTAVLAGECLHPFQDFIPHSKDQKLLFLPSGSTLCDERKEKSMWIML